MLLFLGYATIHNVFVLHSKTTKQSPEKAAWVMCF